MKFEKVVKDYIDELLIKFESFNETGYSFEEWINWELFYAAYRAKLEVNPKPNYENYPETNEKGFGDLLIEGKYFAEIALVHDCTSNKWISKINGDRLALSTLSDSNVTPIQILILVSRHNYLENHKNWQGWLEKISFWYQDDLWSIRKDLPSGGQLVIRCWSVLQ